MKYLEHENVLKANGVSLDNNRNPVLILPYVVNGDLAAYLRRENQPLCYSQEIADLWKNPEKSKFWVKNEQIVQNDEKRDSIKAIIMH